MDKMLDLHMEDCVLDSSFKVIRKTAAEFQRLFLETYKLKQNTMCHIKTRKVVRFSMVWCARQESNLRPSGSEPNALSN